MKTRRLRVQTIAFALIMLASLGLYLSAQAGATGLSWMLVGISVAAVLLALWVS